jgi:hypothetical protein
VYDLHGLQDLREAVMNHDLQWVVEGPIWAHFEATENVPLACVDQISPRLVISLPFASSLEV